MKIALVHDYIKEYGGAERVLETLHAMYPEAPVYTIVYCPEFLGPHQDRFRTWDIRTSWLQKLPLRHKFISIYRLFAFLLFQQFDFSGYDVIVVSATGAYMPNAINKQSAKQLCYCHTPPRYLYGYATAREWKKNIIFRILGETANHFLRMVDYRSSQRVDQFIANSENVAKRIKKFYRRDAIVVYPPAVEGSRNKYQGKKKKENYYLTGGRLARAKHYDLIIKACAELGIQLKVFGKGFAGYEDELRSMVHLKYPISNIKFVGEVSDKEKLELMKDAKALIFAGEDEDFGIVPVESMSVGTPVIAYKSGGVLETVIDGKTGLFFSQLTVESLRTTIKKFEKTRISEEECIAQADKFSKKKFEKGMHEVINKV